MQKIIMSVLLLVMASVPVTAHAINVTINGITYSAAGNSIAVSHNDAKIICRSASNFPNTGAVFEFRESGDIKDMVISDLLCFNTSFTETADLNMSFSHGFAVSNIDTRYYFMSVQGSFFGTSQASPIQAVSCVIFFNSGGRQSDPVCFGQTSGPFSDAFGPQNPVQLVELIDCAFNNCQNFEIVVSFLQGITLAPQQGIYLFGSQHNGSAAKKEDAAKYLAPLTVSIDVLNNNSVGVGTSGTVLVAILGAHHVDELLGNVDFDVKTIDFKTLRLGPLGGPSVAPQGPTTFLQQNTDGVLDVRVRFPNEIVLGKKQKQIIWTCDDKVAVLTGNLTDGSSFTATANVVPSPCP